MNGHAKQDLKPQTKGEIGLAAQIASAFAVVVLCYAFTLAFNGVGGSLLTSACSFVRSGPDVHAKLSKVSDIVKVSCEGPCQECGGGTGRRSSSLDAAPGAKPMLLTTYTPTAFGASSDNLMAASLSTPDRHWCMAEAFKAALDHQRHEVAMQELPANVVIR